MTTGNPIRTLSGVGFLGLLAAFSVGCVSGSAGSYQFESEERGSANEIISAEIRAVQDSHPSAHQVIRELRPSWLRVRSPQSFRGLNQQPVIYLDGVRFGDLNNLFEIDSGDIGGMVYISGLDATTRFGTGHGGGVIEISSR